MSHYSVAIAWVKGDAPFAGGRYSRAHVWEFDGGAVIRASSSPKVVPLPYSDAAAVDPEEALVASLASCHMLWFLSISAKRGFCVESYRDHASGVMGPGAGGKLCMTSVTLRPHVVFRAGNEVGAETVVAMHEEAHGECYIANSVTTQITTIPTFELTVG